uniref:Uncharacterized protein n=1 Tax=Meleagris gallopavo TaxID=9103 RepID=A0A803XKR1_MELGA
RAINVSYFRFWLKWLWRLLTGKCELQRVLEGAKEGARRTLGIEHSLGSSKNKVIIKNNKIMKNRGNYLLLSTLFQR